MRRKIGCCCSCKKQLLFVVFGVVVGFGFLILKYYDEFASSSHLTKLQSVYVSILSWRCTKLARLLTAKQRSACLSSGRGTPLAGWRSLQRKGGALATCLSCTNHLLSAFSFCTTARTMNFCAWIQRTQPNPCRRTVVVASSPIKYQSWHPPGPLPPDLPWSYRWWWGATRPSKTLQMVMGSSPQRDSQKENGKSLPVPLIAFPKAQFSTEVSIHLGQRNSWPLWRATAKPLTLRCRCAMCADRPLP